MQGKSSRKCFGMYYTWLEGDMSTFVYGRGDQRRGLTGWEAYLFSMTFERPWRKGEHATVALPLESLLCRA
jgi:hypothetical protein